MGKTYWSVFLLQAENDEEARRLHETQCREAGEKVVDAELRPCFAALEGGGTDDVQALFEVPSDGDLAPAANYEIEHLEEDGGV